MDIKEAKFDYSAASIISQHEDKSSDNHDENSIFVRNYESSKALWNGCAHADQDLENVSGTTIKQETVSSSMNNINNVRTNHKNNLDDHVVTALKENSIAVPDSSSSKSQVAIPVEQPPNENNTLDDSLLVEHMTMEKKNKVEIGSKLIQQNVSKEVLDNIVQLVSKSNNSTDQVPSLQDPTTTTSGMKNA